MNGRFFRNPKSDWYHSYFERCLNHFTIYFYRTYKREKCELMRKIKSLTPFLRRQIGWISLLYQQSHAGPHNGAHNQRTIALACHIKRPFFRWRGVVLCFFFVFCYLRICWLRNGTRCHSTNTFWPKLPQSPKKELRLRKTVTHRTPHGGNRYLRGCHLGSQSLG